MAINTINTRIKNRIDTISNWQQPNVELLPGEIALVRIPTGDTSLNPVTGLHEPVMELLMKVGENGTDGNPKAFNDLPWLSAKAADVFAWAKQEKADDVEVSVTYTQVAQDGSTTSATTTKTLSKWFAETLANAADISSLDSKFTGAATTEGTVAYAIKTAIDALDSLDNSEDYENSTRKIVKAVTQTDGQVSVTYGELAVSDLPVLHASDIVVVDAQPAQGKEGEDGYIAAVEKVTVADKFTEIDAKLSALDTTLAGGVHFVGIVDAIPEGSTDLEDFEDRTTLEEDSSNNKVYIDGKKYTANTGDIVLVNNIELIWTGTVWKTLGDPSRIGDIEKLVNGLITDEATDTHFVTHISKNDSGALVVNTKQVVATDVARGEGAKSSTVDADLTRIETDYIRIGADNQLYAGRDGSDVIIFDCGGAL